ncbi:MAG: GMC family oxidoreductase, partial [Dehalococcoidia bacterium]
NVRRLPQDYPVNHADSPIEPLMYNAVGGSTIIWGAHFPRFHPSDFRVRSLDGVASDWPVSYEQLEPFYDLNDRMMGIAGMAGDPAYPPKAPRQTRPLPLGKLGDTMAAGFEKLGWHWWPSDAAILTERYDGRDECNNGGSCHIGCARRAKASVDVTYWPKAVAKGAVLKDRCRVREVTLGRDGMADGVVYYDINGQVHHQKARIVVLACNAVGTPRLLLNSTSGLFPNGLANSSGLVGKKLMLHPLAMATGVFDADLEAHKGPTASIIFSHEFYETDLRRGFVRGFSLQVLRSLGPVHVANGGFGGHVVPWGERHRHVFSERFGRTIAMNVMAEDLPEAHNQVSLDPDLTDSDGIPAPKVTYKLGENSRKMLEFGASRASEVMVAAGAKEVLVNPLRRGMAAHLMGTAAMGSNGTKSVVDGRGRCHDVKNLFIIDGSIFATAGAGNPTSTIQAMALFIADNMRRDSRHLLD